MALVVGIDEAGYGPILGPLVVSASAFTVPDDALELDLWSALAATITDTMRKRERRLPILDSKKLHHADAGIATLERSALTMLAAGNRRPRTIGELLATLCRTLPDWLAQYPWYADCAQRAVPLAADDKMIGIMGNAIRQDMAAHGIHFVGAGSAVLPEGHFNKLVTSTRNKATVLWTQTLGLIQRATEHGDHRRVRVVVDRQGGRTNYAQPLMTAFEGCPLTIDTEGSAHSRYGLRVRSGQRDIELTIEFFQGGESRQLPIALASIFSKYVREVLMDVFNAYWAGHVQPLRRTAGYYEDGKRFLEDIEPAVRALAIDRDMLVRTR